MTDGNLERERGAGDTGQRSTSSEEVVARFSRSRNARERLHRWRMDPHKGAVVPIVMEHKTRALYRLSPAEVRETCQTTEHALGEVRKADVSSIASIRDWHPPFATTHVLHIVTEHRGQVPTYQEFRKLCKTPQFRWMLWDPADQAIRDAIREGIPETHARGAMRWRIGNAYYSFLREAYVVAELRDLGLDIRLHPLADALFRVDCWVGEVNVDLFIGNPMFRSGATGRKDPSSRILSDAQPPFIPHSIQLPTEHQFGQVHLPRRQTIREAYEQLAEAAGSGRLSGGGNGSSS